MHNAQCSLKKVRCLFNFWALNEESKIWKNQWTLYRSIFPQMTFPLSQIERKTSKPSKESLPPKPNVNTNWKIIISFLSKNVDLLVFSIENHFNMFYMYMMGASIDWSNPIKAEYVITFIIAFFFLFVFVHFFLLLFQFILFIFRISEERMTEKKNHSR